MFDFLGIDVKELAILLVRAFNLLDDAPPETFLELFLEPLEDFLPLNEVLYTSW